MASASVPARGRHSPGWWIISCKLRKNSFPSRLLLVAVFTTVTRTLTETVSKGISLDQHFENNVKGNEYHHLSSWARRKCVAVVKPNSKGSSTSTKLTLSLVNLTVQEEQGKAGSHWQHHGPARKVSSMAASLPSLPWVAVPEGRVRFSSLESLYSVARSCKWLTSELPYHSFLQLFTNCTILSLLQPHSLQTSLDLNAFKANLTSAM